MKAGGLRAFGPALIVASVVLGPGSILAASRVGADFSYDLLWVLLVAGCLMAGATSLAARLGLRLDDTPCTVLARRAGRPVAVLVGVVLFLIVACFQFSNNVGVLAGLEALVGEQSALEIPILIAINLLAALALIGKRSLYARVEALMKILVLLMAVGFLGNLLLARPDLGAILRGLVPGLPKGVEPAFLPRPVDGGVIDPMLPVVALVGTTFSVAAAFYQAYLVRAKGWTRTEEGRAQLDSLVGIGVLGLLSAAILVTAAAVLHGKVRGDELSSAAEVARQLEPLFGTGARLLFGAGLLAGAFSSFLVNALVGGTVLADGLGLGGRVEGGAARLFTALALLVGLGVALAIRGSQWSPVQLVLFAQAMTVLGNPLLLAVLIWLGLRATPVGTGRPWIALALSSLGFLVIGLLALRKGVQLWYQLNP